MLPSAACVASALAEIPVDVGRDQARDLARRELTAQVYRDAEPSLWERATSWAWEHLTELLSRAQAALGGAGWVFLLLLIVVAVTVLVAWRAGSVERRHRAASATVFDDALLSAAEHRRRSHSAADRGEWDVAVIEAFRALVRDLEERGWLDPRPGRTADEAAREAARHFPGAAVALAEAARTFDEVAYGERGGSKEGLDLVRQADDRVRAGVQGQRR